MLQIAAFFVTFKCVRSARAPKKLLPMGHFLGHIEKQLAIFLVGFAQQAAKLVEVASLFS